MNPSIQQLVAEVDAYLNRHEAAAAMEHLSEAIARMPKETLALARPDVESLIGRFLHKRQRDLRALLNARLGHVATTAPGSTSAETRRIHQGGQRTPVSIGEVLAAAESKKREYAGRLDDLRDHHIFQWSTTYRETLAYIFKDLLQLVRTKQAQRPYLEIASTLLDEHSRDIFQRGFNYITGTLAAATDVAMAKSISGLQRFLFLVIDSYTGAISSIETKEEALALRSVSSAMLSGILTGYSRVRLGNSSGWDLLERYPLQWAHALPFVTASDLQQMLGPAPESEFIRDLSELVGPVLLALDRAVESQPDGGYLLPRFGRYGLAPIRLEASLSLPAQAQKGVVRLTCFLGSSIEDAGGVDDALNAGTSLVVMRAAPALWVAREEAWHLNVVDATRIGPLDDHQRSIADRVLAVLRKKIADAQPSHSAGGGLSHNYAADFPLGDPIVRQFYLVQRQSVRRLLDTFSHGTGAHVWCSVRRSGKTTATVDLAGDTDRSVVIIQTMDQQPNQPDLNLFYSRVLMALEKGAALPADFFDEAVRECSLASSTAKLQQARKVFIVDEYETLFGLLNARARRDDWLRYAVVQPLLSQMASFSTTNLLVFLGQRPDAHFILMSQNQLSPLVRQDSFPLFEHYEQSTETEFSQFLSKVLTPQLPFRPVFGDAVYQETGGHPYLTVNLMVDFCQWLIENNRKVDGLLLGASDFETFVKDRLVPTVLQRSSHYSTFQQMIADNLSEATRDKEPWLYAVTTVLQKIGKLHSKAFACSEPKYKELASDVAKVANKSPGELLQTGEMANFFSTHGGQVRPAVRLFARLAASAVAEVN